MAITFTQTDLDNIKAALVTGATKVQIGDRTVEYRSLKDLKALAEAIDASINGAPASSTPNLIQASFSKGSE